MGEMSPNCLLWIIGKLKSDEGFCSKKSLGEVFKISYKFLLSVTGFFSSLVKKCDIEIKHLIHKDNCQRFKVFKVCVQKIKMIFQIEEPVKYFNNEVLGSHGFNLSHIYVKRTNSYKNILS